MATRDYRLLAYFAEIVEQGGVGHAARHLGLSPPVLSQALSDLEALAGVTLLTRNRKSTVPTADGEELYRAAADMVAAGRVAMEYLGRRRAPSGHLEVTMATELALAWLPDRLRAFEAKHPSIHVEVAAADQLVELSRTRAEVALRAVRHFVRRPAGRRLPTGAIALLDLELVASPTAVAGLPHAPAARLSALPLIAFSATSDRGLYIAQDSSGVLRRIPARQDVTVNNGYVAKEFAKLGFGAALVLNIAAADDIAKKRLVRVCPHWQFGYVRVDVVFRDRHPSPAARAFAEFLKEFDEDRVSSH